MREQLERDLAMLADTIGERHMDLPARLARTADWLEGELAAAGYSVERQGYAVDGRPVANLEAVLPGGDLAAEVVVVGAHYDTVRGTPGADDNGSGVAALLAIARALAGTTPRRTLRFVGFVNEEPPCFQTEAMGSMVYARRCRDRGERVVGMLSLETMGYYSDAPGSQGFPLPGMERLFPDRGHFIGFVANEASRPLLAALEAAFRAASDFPVVGAALDERIPGVAWSDQWSFWQLGYPALMVTDTAPFRNPHYHMETDTVATLSLGALEAVTRGLVAAVRAIADGAG